MAPTCAAAAKPQAAAVHEAIVKPKRSAARGRVLDMLTNNGAVALFQDGLLKEILAGDVSGKLDSAHSMLFV